MVYISTWMYGGRIYRFLIGACGSVAYAKQMARAWFGLRVPDSDLLELNTSVANVSSIYRFTIEMNVAWSHARFETESRVGSQFRHVTKGKFSKIEFTPIPQREGETVTHIVL